MNEVNTSRASFIRANLRSRKRTPVFSICDVGSQKDISIISKNPITEVFFTGISQGELKGNQICEQGSGDYKWEWVERSSEDFSLEGVSDSDFFKIDSEIQLKGNAWEKRKLSYNITPYTILELEFKSSIEPESSMLVFDRENLLDISTPCIQFFGYDLIADSTANEFKTYDGSGEWLKYKIRLGQYFTGKFTKLAFVNDACDSQADSRYKNILIYESEPKFDLTFSFKPELDAQAEVYSNVCIKTNENGVIKDHGSQRVRLFSPNEIKEINIEGLRGQESNEENDKVKKELEQFDSNIESSFLAKEEILEEDVEESPSLQPTINLFTEGALNFGGAAQVAELDIVINGDVDPEKLAGADLFSILQFEVGVQETKWAFSCSSNCFDSLSKQDSIVLMYKIQSQEINPQKRVDLILTIVGTSTSPIVMNTFDKISGSSDFIKMDLLKGRLSENTQIEDLSLSLSGPASEEFVSEINESGLFSLDPSQFQYLKEKEKLTVVGVYCLIEDGLTKPEAFTIIIEGEKKVSPVLTSTIEFNERPIRGRGVPKGLTPKGLTPKGLTPKFNNLNEEDTLQGYRLESFAASDLSDHNNENELSFDSSSQSMNTLEKEKKQKDFRIITQYNLDEQLNLNESLVGDFDCFQSERPQKS